MVIRGAPAIGVAAAMGAAIGVERSKAASVEELREEFAGICDTLAKTRPTAVDLFWAIERFRRRFAELAAGNGANGSASAALARIRAGLVAEAQQVHEERRAADRQIGMFGAEFMPRDGRRVMTQCNAGAGHGRNRHGAGRDLRGCRQVARGVLVPETPYLQGARLTAWSCIRSASR